MHALPDTFTCECREVFETFAEFALHLAATRNDVTYIDEGRKVWKNRHARQGAVTVGAVTPMRSWTKES